MKFRTANLTLVTCSILGLVLTSLATGCGKSDSSSSTEDSSTSGTVAAMVGGAYNGSSGSGTVAFYNEPALHRPFNWWKDAIQASLPFSTDAWASSVCPTILGSASGCSAGSNQVTMSYSDCSFRGSAATWSGSQTIAATGIACGTFPSSYTGNVTRTFGSSTVRTAASGSSVEIDTSGALTMTRLGSAGVAADGSTYTGGTTVHFTNGVRDSLTVNGINYIGKTAGGTESFSHSLSSSAVTISGGNAVNGTISVIHNLIKVKATATLNDLTFSSGCCQPTGGSITTTFTALSGAGVAAQAFSGATESLTFTGCGTATYTGPEGYSGNVTIAHCL